MKRYLPHLSFFALLLVILVVGIATNNHATAFFFGSLAAFVTDPLLLLGALAIGVISVKLEIVLPVAVVFGLLLSLYIADLNEPLGAEFRWSTTAIRTVAIIAIVLISNTIRRATSSKQSAPSS